MKTLIIDTSHRYLAVGYAEEGKLLSSRVEALNKQQSEYLVPFVQDVLTQAKTALSELDAIVVCDGPGSYTGMRIGITFVKSVAMVFETIKIYKVNTLLSLSGMADVFAFIDARSGRTFGAYCHQGSISEERVYQVEELEAISIKKVGDVQLINEPDQEIPVLENILSVASSWVLVDNVDVLVPRYLK